MRRLLAGVLLAVAAAPGRAQSPPAPPAAPPAERPTLVVLIAVDQLRADYLDRFGAQLEGGLARLVRGGARFTDAHHDHAITETAPGHATLLSGRFPRGTGISSNWAGVEDSSAALLDGAPGPGASPGRFRGTTLVDWLRARDRRSRALAVSAKDRSAILPVGRAREHVYWYAPDGRFTTSRYYGDTLPAWVRGFNDRRLAQRRAGASWQLLLPEAAYPERDSVPLEGAGRDFTFPHTVPADSAAAASYVRVTPWIDELTLDFALGGVQALALGAGPHADVLSVSLSGTDYIGHRYGPDSREMHDQVLRLDRALGRFLDSLYRLRPADRVVVALTADHGVGPIPELAPAGAGPPPTRADPAAWDVLLQEGLRRARVDARALWLDGPVVAIDREAFARARVDPARVLAALAAEARQLPGVLRVDRWADLLAADTAADVVARRWLHQYPAAAPVGLVVTLTPASVWGLSVATHGSPHAYDSHVPLILYGPPFRPGRYDGFVRTVDLAPTLAAVVGVRPSERVDGVVLRRALR